MVNKQTAVAEQTSAGPQAGPLNPSLPHITFHIRKANNNSHSKSVAMNLNLLNKGDHFVSGLLSWVHVFRVIQIGG